MRETVFWVVFEICGGAGYRQFEKLSSDGGKLFVWQLLTGR